MMLMQLNMVMRQTLLLELGLRSEYFENCLVRTEALLQKSKYQKGLKLVRRLPSADEYRGVIDFLLGLFSPEWDQQIKGFYHHRGQRMIRYVEWETIDEVDQVVATALKELTRLYEMYRREGWKEVTEEGVDNFDGAEEYEELTRAAIKLFVQPHVPLPPEQPCAEEEETFREG
jgi:hypothetical protein